MEGEGTSDFVATLVIIGVGLFALYLYHQHQVATALGIAATNAADPFSGDPGSGFGSPLAKGTQDVLAYTAPGVNQFLNWQYAGMTHPETVKLPDGTVKQIPGNGVGATDTGVMGGVATVAFGPIGAIETIGKQGYLGSTVESAANKVGSALSTAVQPWKW